MEEIVIIFLILLNNLVITVGRRWKKSRGINPISKKLMFGVLDRQFKKGSNLYKRIKNIS